MEYTSAATLRERLRQFVVAHCTGLQVVRENAHRLASDDEVPDPAAIEREMHELLTNSFRNKSVRRKWAEQIISSADTTQVLNALRSAGVLQVEGERAGARWVFTDQWVHSDHEVSGA